MPKFDLVIFDLDGVLVDTSTCHTSAFRDLWEKIGVEVPPYESIAGGKTNELVARFTGHLNPTATELAEWTSFKQQRAHYYITNSEIGFADTYSTLLTLAKHRFRLAIGTGASRVRTELILRQLGVEDLFLSIRTADDVNHGKPSPEVFLKNLEDTNTSSDSSLVVEDSVNGLQAAIDAGIYAVSVRTGHEFDDPRFLGTFRDLEQLGRSLVSQ